MEKLAIIITSMPIHRTLFSWPTHVPVCVCVCACSISFFFVDLHAQRKWQTGFFPSKSYRVQVFSERKSWQSFGALWRFSFVLFSSRLAIYHGYWLYNRSADGTFEKCDFFFQPTKKYIQPVD